MAPERRKIARGDLNHRARFGGARREGEPPGEPRLGGSLALPRRKIAYGDLAAADPFM